MKDLLGKTPIIDARVAPMRGKMTSALWSCELHQELCFAAADATATLLQPARDHRSWQPGAPLRQGIVAFIREFLRGSSGAPG